MVNLRVITRNKKMYYYLEHTLRKGNSFENKRLYLGATLPKNIEELKENFLAQVYESQYGMEFNSIKTNFNKEYSSPLARKKFIESFMVKFTYDTNKIEGGTLTLKETADLLQEDITPRNKPNADVKEAESHKKVFYEMLNYNGDLSMQIILFWHKLLIANPDIAGKFRSHQVAIARSKVELPIPAEIETLINEFFRWYKKSRNINPIVLAAMVHLKFVSIHPFTDGNGRISRLMMNFVLNKHNFPMLNIKYKNRTTYYNALERSQINKKADYFVNFIVKRYLDEYRKFSNPFIGKVQ